MTKLLTFLVLLFGIGPVCTHAQEPESTTPMRPVPSTVSATIKQVAPNVGTRRVLDLITGSTFSTSILDGTGTFESTATENEAQIFQRGDRNYVFLQQFGIANIAFINVDGNDNQIYNRQNGDQNILDVSILNGGIDNVVPIIQDGDGNQLSLTLDGINNWTIGNLPGGFFGTQRAAFVSPTGAPIDAITQSSVGNPIPLRIEVRRAGN